MRNLHDEYRSRQQELQRVKEEQKTFIQEIKRTQAQEMAFGDCQKEGGKGSDEERRQLTKEAGKARCEWRKRLLEEQRVRAEQRKLDEDMKKWREEETLRRAMEDKSKRRDSGNLMLDHQRQQVDEIIRISEQIVRNTEMPLPTEDVGDGRFKSARENPNSPKDKEQKELRDKAEKGIADIRSQTDSDDDEDWQILAKLKREQTKKSLPLETETGRFEQVKSIRVPDNITAKSPEEFCITQILETKQEADRKRAARVQQAMREKDKRSLNLDNHIYKLVSKSTKMPTNLDSEMQKILEKVRATTVREGELMEEVLQAKEASESGKHRLNGSSVTRTRKRERTARGHKLKSWNDDSSFNFLLNKLDSTKKFDKEPTLKILEKDAPIKRKEIPLPKGFQWSNIKREGKPRRALEPIPFLKFNGSSCLQNSPPRSRYMLRR